MPLYTRKDTFESARVYEGGIINLRVDRLRHGKGKPIIREVVEHNGGVVIACLPEPGKIALIRQYRYSVDEELIELPAGRIEIGEDPFDTAKRELTEETGYVAQDWEEMVRMYSAPGFCNEMLYLYKAWNVKLAEKRLDEDEETEVTLMTFAQAWKLVVGGKIRDAKTIAGLGMLLAQLT